MIPRVPYGHKSACADRCTLDLVGVHKGTVDPGSQSSMQWCFIIVACSRPMELQDADSTCVWYMAGNHGNPAHHTHVLMFRSVDRIVDATPILMWCVPPSLQDIL